MKLKEKKNTVLAELNDGLTSTPAHTHTFKMPHIHRGFFL